MIIITLCLCIHRSQRTDDHLNLKDILYVFCVTMLTKADNDKTESI